MKKLIVLFYLASLNLVTSAQTITANPNPCSKRTLISFSLLVNDTVSLSVTNVMGSAIATVYTNSPKAAGNYQDSLILDNFPAGIYFVSLKLKQGNSQALKIVKTDPVGIQENNNTLHFKIFPNPFSGRIYVESPSIKRLQVEIFNSLGQIVYSIEKIQSSQEIDLSFLKGGIYFLRANDSIEKKVLKILKE
jgi:hypothetical protein